MKYIIIPCLLLLMFIQLKSKDKEKAENLVKVVSMSSHSEIAPGSQLMLIFDFKIKKGWHIYWKNPGDTGLQTNIDLELNKEIKPEDMLWPVPKKFPFDDMMIYGYDDSVRFLIPVNIPEDIKKGEYSIKAIANYLVCKEECLPGADTSVISFKVSDRSKLNIGIDEIDLNKYPINSNNENVSAKIVNDTLYADIPINKLNDAKYYIEFFPEDQGYYIYSGIKSNLTSEYIDLIMPMNKYRESNPDILNGLLVFRNYSDHQISSSFYLKSKINNK